MFEASIAAHAAGVYRFRVLGSGKTFHGLPFTRELLVTASVWRGGDAPDPTGKGDPNRDRDRWCKLAQCLLKVPGLSERLVREGIDVRALAKCLKSYCTGQHDKRGDLVVSVPTPKGVEQFLADPQVRRALAALMEGGDHEMT